MNEKVKVNQQDKPIFATVGIMMVVGFIGKIMGLFRDRMLVVHYGTDTAESIAFTAASVLPRVFLDIMFAAVFSASFIPVFNEYLETKGKREAFNLAARFIMMIGFITLAMTVLFIMLASPIFDIFVGAEYDNVVISTLGVHLLRILFPLMFLSGLAFSLASMLQSLGNFNIPAAMSIVSNGIILLYYFFFIDYFGIYGLAITFLIAWGAQIIIQIPFLVKHRFKLSFRNFTWRDEGLRKIAQLSLPVMVATWVAPVNLLVNGRVSNIYGGEHGYVAINLAHGLYSIIAGLFVLSLANVILPKLSRLATLGNMNAYAESVRDSLKSLFFLLIPMTFGLMAIAHPLVRLVFQSGDFGHESTLVTSTALFYFSLGILGFGLQVILCRAFYAIQYGRAPLITGIIAMVINLILSVMIAPIIGIGGPALASSISISISAILLFIILRHKLPNQLFWTRDMTIDTIKIIIISIAMFFVAKHTLYFTESFFDEITFLARIFTILIPVILGAGLYILGCFLFRVSALRKITTQLWRKT
ncbi:MAG: murein biosynthesis integral membrane protein MurJ [Defluviitaleaceae bacterium]|nr:murein biosynthesis integral membrane protein MurJ [Defluviitaleaceae bacterium]